MKVSFGLFLLRATLAVLMAERNWCARRDQCSRLGCLRVLIHGWMQWLCRERNVQGKRHVKITLFC